MTDEQFTIALQLARENERLRKKVARLEIELKTLKEEMRKEERMTPAENRAYWGIYG